MTLSPLEIFFFCRCLFDIPTNLNNAQDFRIGCPKYTFWVNLGVQFLFIPLHHTQKIWILGCPKSAIAYPKDTRTPPPAKDLTVY